MLQNQIPFEYRILNFVDDKQDALKLAKETPINKVPFLIEGSQKIFDSRVIVNHLIQKHKLRALTLEEENIVTAVYSCMDVGVTLFLMKRDGFDLSKPGFFLDRQKARIPANLAFVADWASQLGIEDWNYASISLFSCLYWLELRTGLVKVSDHPVLQKFMQKFAEAPGIRETHF